MERRALLMAKIRAPQEVLDKWQNKCFAMCLSEVTLSNNIFRDKRGITKTSIRICKGIGRRKTRSKNL